MPDVTITGTRAWLTDPADPGGTAVVCGTVQTSDTVATLDGTVRSFAGGRKQAAVYDQDDYVLTYALRHLSPTDLAQIIAWRGRTLLLRTVDGERVFVVYFVVPHHRLLSTTPDDGDGTTTFDATLTFDRVSYDESV